MSGIDQATKFGTWGDETSKWMYNDCIDKILPHCGIKTSMTVADYGGGNGLLKDYIPQAVSIDIDIEKKPDILDDVITHQGRYDMVVMRYLLHYLTDTEVIKMFNNIRSKRVLVIQFYNEDLKIKYYNSINETKYFRTFSQILALIPKGRVMFCEKYAVGKEFYKNRLGNDNGIAHTEFLLAYLIG